MPCEVRFDRMADAARLERFLRRMDGQFPHPLSSRCDLGSFSAKLVEHGVVEAAWEGDELLGVLAGYANDAASGEAYISVLVVDPCHRGRKISSTLLERFADEARRQGMRAVRVYTYRTNEAAYGLYTAHGFEDLGLLETGDFELLRKL